MHIRDTQAPQWEIVTRTPTVMTSMGKIFTLRIVSRKRALLSIVREVRVLDLMTFS